MEAHPEPSQFQKFDAVMRQIISVPKVEIDKRAVAAKKQRDHKREVQR